MTPIFCNGNSFQRMFDELVLQISEVNPPCTKQEIQKIFEELCIIKRWSKAKVTIASDKILRGLYLVFFYREEELTLQLTGDPFFVTIALWTLQNFQEIRSGKKSS